MKQILSILLITLMNSCNAQLEIEAVIVPYEKNPETPSKDFLDKLNLVAFELLNITIKERQGGKRIKVYRMDSVLFNGWTIQIFNDNDHRYRYVHYTDGLTDWQIGYFDNGELDHDFHMKNAMNCGSTRMWQKGGCLYIKTYFLEGGIIDGPALAWHENCNLSRDAFYEKGEMLFEVKFDQEGKIIERKGQIPEKYK